MATHRTGTIANARFDLDHGIEDASRLVVVEPPGIGQRHGARRACEQRASRDFPRAA